MEKDVASTLFVATGESFWRAGKKEEAITVLKKGLEAHPNYPPVHFALGQCYWENGDLTSAKEEFAAVLKLDPENILAYRSLAKIYSQSGEEKLLAEAYEAVLQLDPFDPEAKAYYDQSQAQRIPFATVSIAELYESQGYWVEALDVYKELLSREPDNETIKNKIAVLSAKIGQ
jgi:tetratricopeptide (TPR) repeat protein